MKTIFEGIITSKMRIRILMRLFLNPQADAYLRELATEFDVSTSQVSGELQQLARAGLVTHNRKGKQINYQANSQHALFPELQSMVKKALGMDQILESIINRLGNLEEAVLLDDYACGRDTGIIDLLLIGNIDMENLQDLVGKTEKYIGRKIRTLVLSRTEYLSLQKNIEKRSRLVLWKGKTKHSKPDAGERNSNPV